VLLGKFKEKAAVAKAAGDALQSMARHAFALPDVAEDIVAGLGHQHPKVRTCGVCVACCLSSVCHAPRGSPSRRLCLQQPVNDALAARLPRPHTQVKEGTLAWLTGCVVRETKAGVVKLVPAVIPAAAKCAEDGSPAIREAALAFLVQAALRVRW
jgi:hypothetical protein